MSFRSCYAVIDAWQKVHRLRDGIGEWALLLWLCRQADDKTMTVVRSQARLGAELGVTDRTIRDYIRAWRDRGVLQILEHGGGQGRKPARYRIALPALEVFALKNSLPTPERQNFRMAKNGANSGSPNSSGVESATPEPQTLPQLDSGAESSGVEPQLRKFPGAFEPNSGSPWASTSSEYSEKIRSKEALPQDIAQPQARSLTRSPRTAARSRAHGLDESDPRIQEKRRQAMELLEKLKRERAK
jgi:hypothetical protein